MDEGFHIMMLKSAKFSTYKPITTQEKRSLNCNGGDWFRIDIFYAKFHIPKKKNTSNIIILESSQK